MLLFVIINNVGIKINVANRCECSELIDKVICNKRFFGILVIVNVNVINHVILVNI